MRAASESARSGCGADTRMLNDSARLKKSVADPKNLLRVNEASVMMISMRPRWRQGRHGDMARTTCLGRGKYTTRAAFWFDSDGWVWIRWSHNESNLHKAAANKAVAIGARGYDTGNADHDETSRYSFATRS